MSRFAASLALLALAACSPSSESTQRTPAGTPTDPVDECARVADVCRLDESRLGVCTAPPPGEKPAACEGREPCLLCMSQH